jgi:hypothetical protein
MQPQILPNITGLYFVPMENMHTQHMKPFTSLKSPFGYSHHAFPNLFNFCPYCGSKLKDLKKELLRKWRKEKIVAPNACAYGRVAGN